MKKTIIVDSLPIGIISDCHKKWENVKKIMESNPNIKQWVCLGDITDFLDPVGNRIMMDWWIANMGNVPTLRGNHEEVVVHRLLDINFTHRAYLINNLYTSFEIIMPNKKKLLAFHNKPKDNWSFLEKTYTEREFIDQFLDINDDIQSVLIGHNHTQFVLNFPNIWTQIWSVGAAKFGEYAIIESDGIRFHRLP